MKLSALIGAGLLGLATAAFAYEGAPAKEVQSVIRESTSPYELPVNVWNPSPGCEVTWGQISNVVDRVLIRSRLKRVLWYGTPLYLNPVVTCFKTKAGTYVYSIDAVFKRFDKDKSVFWQLEGSYGYIGIATDLDALLDVVEDAMEAAVTAFIYSHTSG